MVLYDVVVIGGGHNGVVVASLLAREGLRVALVEKNYTLGGLAGGEYHRLTPSSRYAYAVGLVPPELNDILQLFGEGDLTTSNPSWVELDEDMEIVFRWWLEEEKLLQEFRTIGAKEVQELFTLAKKFWSCYKRKKLYYTPSPPSKEQAVAELEDCSKEATLFLEKPVDRILSSYLPRDYWDLLIYPSMFSANGFVLAYYLQNKGVWSLPKKGMTILSKRLRELAVKSGVELLLGSKAEEIIVENNRASRVLLSTGEKIEAKKAIVYSAPIASLLQIRGHEALEERDIRVLEKIASTKYPVMRVDYYLSAQPTPPREESWKGIPIYTYWTSKGGGEYTYISSRSSYLVQLSGYIEDPYAPLPPGVQNEENIVDIRVKSLESQEKCCSNPTGHPDHIPMVDPYLFNKRPLPEWGDYKTSLPGLYHASASSYPGGEVVGVPGFNAALRILVDLGLEARASRLEKEVLKRI